MAQLPASLRQRRASAAQSVPAPTMTEKLSYYGSWGLIGLALLLCGAGGWALLHTLRYAPVATIRLAGELSPLERTVLQTKLQPLVQKGYFSADLGVIRDGALSVPWVDRVVVTRHWPNGILVRVMPRHAIARWGSGRMLSDDGHIFVEARYQERRELPLLHGPVSQSVALMEQYRQINQWFAPMDMRLQELYLTDRMTWFMRFNTGLRVIVDQEQTNAKLLRLSQLGLHELHAVWPRMAAVDLRYRNGMSVQWQPGKQPQVADGHLVISPDPVVAVTPAPVSSASSSPLSSVSSPAPISPVAPKAL